MPTATLYRGAGIVGLIASVLNVAAELVPRRLGLPVDVITNILGLWVLAALYLRQREASGRLGLVGYALQSFGLTLLLGFLFADAFVLIGLDAAARAALIAGSASLAAVIGLALTVFGALLFGIATLRAGVFPRWGAVLLMVGFLLVPVGAAVPGPLKTIAEIVLSAGLFWLSLALLRARLPSAPLAASPVLSKN